MGFDAIATACSCKIICDHITGGRIEKIVQSSSYTIAFVVRSSGHNHYMLLSADPRDARVTLTGTRPAKAFHEAGAFVMLLRKYLEGSIVQTVEQQDFDRIIRMTAGPPRSAVSLIAEIMGKHSNVILVDSKDTILGALKPIPPHLSRVRTILPHHPYIRPPEPQRQAPLPSGPKLDPRTLQRSDLVEALASFSPMSPFAETLFSLCAGISKEAAREFTHRVTGEALAANAAVASRVDRIPDALAEFLTVDESPPSLAYDGNNRRSWAAFTLTHLSRYHVFPDLTTLLDDVYCHAESSDGLMAARADVRARISTELRRVQSRLSSLHDQLQSQDDIDALRTQGEMILAFAHDVSQGSSTLKIDELGLTIPLDAMLSPTENAAQYFNRYRKRRDARAAIPPLVEDAEARLSFLEDCLVFADQAESDKALQDIVESVGGGNGTPHASVKSKRPPSYRESTPMQSRKSGKARPMYARFSTSDGLAILIGRSATQNDMVTFREAGRDDLWFHARGYPGSHVVLRTFGTTPPASSIEEAAAAAAYFSKARDNTTAAVDIVPIRDVRKVKGGPPGLVTIRNETTIMVTPARPTA